MRLSFVYRDISYVVGGVEMDKKEGIGRLVYVGDREIELVCPICGGKKFYERKTLMNTAGMTFMGWEWANPEAINYICEDCSYIYWFMEDPTVVPEGEKPLTRAQQYEIEFEDMSTKKLYQILNDADYNNDAKKAAKNVLRGRKMPV